ATGSWRIGSPSGAASDTRTGGYSSSFSSVPSRAASRAHGGRRRPLAGRVLGARAGGRAVSARRALDSIRQSSPNVSGDQTQRLFSLSSNGRLDTWESALDDARAHPAGGPGAGTFERWWLEHRDVPLKVRDAHNLYVETLAELGPIGLAGLLAIVVTPLVAAVRARRSP